MKDKVLVKIIVPEIDKEFDAYIPVAKKVGNVINLLNEYISTKIDSDYKLSKADRLYNAMTGERYASDILVASTNIRNGTRLVLISNIQSTQ